MFSDLGETQILVFAPLYQAKPAEVVYASDGLLSRSLFTEVFWVCPTRRTQNTLVTVYLSDGNIPEELEDLGCFQLGNYL